MFTNHGTKMNSMAPSEVQVTTETNRVRNSRTKQDVQGVIRAMMSSPIRGDTSEVVQLDGKISIASLKGKSLDVQTRLLMGVLEQALAGDLHAVKLLFEYGGYEPPKQQNVSLELPTIVDDIPIPEPKTVLAPSSKAIEAPVRDITPVKELTPSKSDTEEE